MHFDSGNFTGWGSQGVNVGFTCVEPTGVVQKKNWRMFWSCVYVPRALNTGTCIKGL